MLTLSRPTKAILLLGSGVSIPAGMPKTQELTDRILSGNGIMRHSDGNYYFGQPLFSHMGIPDDWVPRIVQFLNRLKVEVDSYYKRGGLRQTNYEDICYVAGQIYDSEVREYDNPAVQPFIEKILPDIRSLLCQPRLGNDEPLELWELALEVENYIRDVVTDRLRLIPSDTDYLNILIDSFSEDYLKVDLFTLNHDTVLERQFLKRNIRITDGFTEAINNIRYWNPLLYENSPSNIRLFKLHGSIDWFRVRPDGGDWRHESVVVFLTGEWWAAKNEEGQLLRLMEHRPMILAGTFNKMLDYLRGIYADIHYRLYSSLQEVSRLLICGYGFGDKGINTRIIEWVYSSTEPKKILLIHPAPNELKLAAKPAIRNHWERWVATGTMIIISKRIEDISKEEIKENLY